LRQCLISLREDLSLASEILAVDRETMGLRAQFISVDARTFMSLARSNGPDALAQAAELWNGPFLPDLGLDIEEFDTWHRQEADRLSAMAAGDANECLVGPSAGSAATRYALPTRRHGESLGCLPSRLAISARCACVANPVQISRSANWWHVAI